MMQPLFVNASYFHWNNLFFRVIICPLKGTQEGFAVFNGNEAIMSYIHFSF